MTDETQPIAPCARDFSPTFSKLQVVTRNSDYFLALFVDTGFYDKGDKNLTKKNARTQCYWVALKPDRCGLICLMICTLLQL